MAVGAICKCREGIHYCSFDGFFQMESIGDYPAAHCFENNTIHKPYETRKQYFDGKIGKFVDNYIFQSNQSPSVVLKEIL